jgi:large subunit ribosomal protein L24
MKIKKFSSKWKSSINQQKQRKYAINAPLHIKQKLMRVHLSEELRKKYNQRNILVRVDDKVKVLRGDNKGKTGKVEKVDLKKGKIRVTGVELIKKDGSKAILELRPNSVMIIELKTGDKKRKIKTGEKKNEESP